MPTYAVPELIASSLPVEHASYLLAVSMTYASWCLTGSGRGNNPRWRDRTVGKVYAVASELESVTVSVYTLSAGTKMPT